MSDLPQSIWADPPDIFDDMSIWYNYQTKGQTKYVRADTVQAQIDEERERHAGIVARLEAKIRFYERRENWRARETN
jgi:hypothetical protein